MAEFHLAGKANDPAVADAEVVIQDLAMNLPDITLVSHIKDPVRMPRSNRLLIERYRTNGRSGPSNCVKGWASMKPHTLQGPSSGLQDALLAITVI